MHGIYAVVDIGTLATLQLDPVQFAQQLLLNPLAAIQIRAKNVSAAKLLEYLIPLREVAVRVGVPFFANDRPDLAVLGRCSGVHVGQGDLSVAHVRKLAPQLLVGVSTHTLSQVKEALPFKPDYLAFGPIFATRSKSDAEACVGLSGLAKASLLCRKAGVPLVAIGGIDEGTITEVSRYANCVAVISALVPRPGDGSSVPGRHAQLIRLQAESALG